MDTEFSEVISSSFSLCVCVCGVITTSGEGKPLEKVCSACESSLAHGVSPIKSLTISAPRVQSGSDHNLPQGAESQVNSSLSFLSQETRGLRLSLAGEIYI